MHLKMLGLGGGSILRRRWGSWCGGGDRDGVEVVARRLMFVFVLWSSAASRMINAVFGNWVRVYSTLSLCSCTDYLLSSFRVPILILVLALFALVFLDRVINIMYVFYSIILWLRCYYPDR